MYIMGLQAAYGLPAVIKPRWAAADEGSIVCNSSRAAPPGPLLSPNPKMCFLQKEARCSFASCKRICWILPKDTTANTPFWQLISAGRRNRNSAASCQMKEKIPFFFFSSPPPTPSPFCCLMELKTPVKKKISEKIFLFVLTPLLLTLQPLCVPPTSSHADGRNEGCSVQDLPGCSHLSAQPLS